MTIAAVSAIFTYCLNCKATIVLQPVHSSGGGLVLLVMEGGQQYDIDFIFWMIFGILARRPFK